MEAFPQLKTDRLILGRVTVSDIPTIVKYAGNKKVSNMTLNIPHPYKEEHAIFWINNANQGFENKSLFTFGILIKSTNEFIGGIGLKVNTKFDRAEIAYWIGEPFWNQGFATESVKAILYFGFEQLNLNKIYATHLNENPASGKVMLKNGMIKEGILKDHTKKGNTYKSLIQYRLTKKEFKNLT